MLSDIVFPLLDYVSEEKEFRLTTIEQANADLEDFNLHKHPKFDVAWVEGVPGEANRLPLLFTPSDGNELPLEP
jgi:hypothetical protein